MEAAAKYSKQRWPNMPTLVNAPVNWLASVGVTYVYLDAGWAMFRAKTSSSRATWAAIQVSRAKSKGLGLIAGLNVLDGGDGWSGLRGTEPKTWAMSAARHVLQSGDVKSAMADLSGQAKSHARTSCRQ